MLTSPLRSVSNKVILRMMVLLAGTCCCHVTEPRRVAFSWPPLCRRGNSTEEISALHSEGQESLELEFIRVLCLLTCMQCFCAQAGGGWTKERGGNRAPPMHGFFRRGGDGHAALGCRTLAECSSGPVLRDAGI